MPAMANMTVLDGAGGNVVYTAATPSAGDRSPAVWRANALSGRLSERPIFTVLTRDNAKRTARHLSITHRFPITFVDPVTSVSTIVATVPFSCEVTLPINVDAVDVKNAFVQAGNLIVQTLIRSVAEEGYAPT